MKIPKGNIIIKVADLIKIIENNPGIKEIIIPITEKNWVKTPFECCGLWDGWENGN